jgi:hypothetical protein
VFPRRHLLPEDLGRAPGAADAYSAHPPLVSTPGSSTGITPALRQQRRLAWADEDISEESWRAEIGAGDIVFAANLAMQCLRAGLLDEIVIHLLPVLLGDGAHVIDGFRL